MQLRHMPTSSTGWECRAAAVWSAARRRHDLDARRQRPPAVFRLRRQRLRALVADRDIAAGATGAPIAWGDDRGELRIVACGRCATCDAEVVAHRDLLLVAGMRPVQRDRLRAAGIHTIDDLAAASAASRADVG
jgi:hypothetical protein